MAVDGVGLQLGSWAEASYIAGLSILYPLIRYILDSCILTPINEALLLPTSLRGLKRKPDKATKKVVKLTESQWKLFNYFSFVILNYLALRDQPWFTDTRQYWLDWPNQPIQPAVRVLFHLQLAYYISTTVMLAVWEVPRKDYYVMQFHHCAAVVLISLCYLCNYTRSGSVIMLLHDVNDVCMEVAKCCKYCKMEVAAKSVFALFVLSWVATRLTIFPFVVLRSTIWEVTDVLGYKPPYYYTINALFIALLLIHLYWFSLILKIIWQVLQTGTGNDVREDDSDDD